ncbi:MAG: hypothetical protein PHG24_02780 [Candidatus Pacebacteria bacterium]|nr:hypothetical protein [Candidatus Paceibacterota bacterium]
MTEREISSQSLSFAVGSETKIDGIIDTDVKINNKGELAVTIFKKTSTISTETICFNIGDFSSEEKRSLDNFISLARNSTVTSSIKTDGRKVTWLVLKNATQKTS